MTDDTVGGNLDFDRPGIGCRSFACGRYRGDQSLGSHVDDHGLWHHTQRRLTQRDRTVRESR